MTYFFQFFYFYFFLLYADSKDPIQGLNKGLDREIFDEQIIFD